MEAVDALDIIEVLTGAVFSAGLLPVKMVAVFVGALGILGGSQVAQTPCREPLSP